MRAVISFLTRIPAGSTDIEDAARHAYLFPVVGILIGLIASLIGYGSINLFSNEIGAFFTILSIYFMTGLVHLDGLSDFSDGIMASGSKKEKISAMKDVAVGIGGIFSVVFVLLTSFYTISHLGEMTLNTAIQKDISWYQFSCALIMSEVSAKLSMNTCIVMGREMPDGLGQLFIMRSTKKKYIAAVTLSVLVGIILTRSYFVVVLTGVIIAVVVVKLAHKNFGGINGDVMGASNEISRTVTLLVWAVVY